MKKSIVIIILLFVSVNFLCLVKANNANKGRFCNIVVFVRFAGNSEFSESFAYYDSLFNSKKGASLYDYYNEVSYNQLSVNSYFLHKDTIISYLDGHPRNFYSPKSNSNSAGYLDLKEGAKRKSELLQNVCEFVKKYIDKKLVVDEDNNEYVDNITIILNGNSDGNSNTLWPHQNKVTSDDFGFFSYINDKQVFNYVIIPSQSLHLGTLCHEFFHVLGATDLYHQDKLNSLTPMFYWDLMETQYRVPQYMSIYMKYRYGNWLDAIPRIVHQGEYALKPSSQKDSNCFSIVPLYGTEYVILEYRKAVGKYELSLKSMLNTETSSYIENDGGLLIYRINTSKDGEGNLKSSVGIPDEVYCYRPDGTNSKNGRPWNALFNSKYGRDKFNHSSNPAPIKFDGTMMDISISDIYETCGKLYFTFHSNDATFIKYPSHLADNVSLKPVIRWDLLEFSKNYSVQISEINDFTNQSFIVLDDVVINDSLCYVKQALKPNSTYFLRVGVVEGYNVARWSSTVSFHTTKNISLLSNLSQYCAGETVEIHYESSINLNNNIKIYLTEQNGVIKNPILLNYNISQTPNKIICQLPKSIPTGYKYKLLIQEINDTNNKVFTPIFRVKGIPEAKFLPFDTLICKNSTSTISYIPIDSNVKDSYHKFDWQVKNGKIIQDDSNSITILWENIGIGEVKLTTQNEMGCANEYLQTIYISQVPTIFFSSKNVVCPNVPVSYYLPENNSITTNIEITNGTYQRKNKDSILITWNNVDTGYIKIINSLNNYECKDSLLVAQKINKKPIVSILGKDEFCKNDTAEYSINIVDINKYSVQWNCYNGSIVDEAQGICKIMGSSDTLILSVILTDNITNCATDLVEKKIILHNIPDTPTINFEDDKLISSVETDNYQWFLDDELIENSNSKTITPTSEGDYYVIVENKYGCKNKSEPYKLSNIFQYNLCPKFIQTENIIAIYFDEEKQTAIIELYDLLSNKILTKRHLNASEITCDISSFARGIYLLRLHTENQTLNKIIIK